jgi:mannose-6-phosphate isomerase-like protein (cupin superfamily)
MDPNCVDPKGELAMLSGKLAIVTICSLVLILPLLTIAQTAPPTDDRIHQAINSFPEPALVKYAKARDTEDRKIDLFFGDWRESMPRQLHGALILRDILTHGDNFAPPQKAAVLQYTNFLSYATLAAGASTTPARLEGQQEIYYVVDGSGKIAAGGETANLHNGSAVLMPAQLEFVMQNTGDQPLHMYIINEPTPGEFRPNDKMLVKDEQTATMRALNAHPLDSKAVRGHWAHIVRELFQTSEGLGTLESVITVELDPLTLGEPHPHQPGHEEVWTAVEGTTLAMMGTELRLQHPGMAFMLRPDGLTLHSNINYGDTRVKFLYFARSKEHKVRK